MVYVSREELRRTRKTRVRYIVFAVFIAVATARVFEFDIDFLPGTRALRGQEHVLKKWRQQITGMCMAATDEVGVMNIGSNVKNFFALPAERTRQPRGVDAIRRCKRVVLDLGANTGTGVGELIDSGLLPCDRKDLQVKSAYPHLNVDKKQFEEVGRRSALTKHLTRMMKENGSGPEDFCYYGVEGNPVFTQNLQELEDFIMALNPRPVEHIHFFTESVGAGYKGQATLYLDTASLQENFQGSSLLKSHKDVQRSASSNKGELVTADVRAYTLEKLMAKTLSAYEPQAGNADWTDNHLILRIDIEGAEYELLQQAVDDGVLCEFVRNGNKADLFVEFHSESMTGPNPLSLRTDAIKEKLMACGVNFKNLAAWWA